MAVMETNQGLFLLYTDSEPGRGIRAALHNRWCALGCPGTPATRENPDPFNTWVIETNPGVSDQTHLYHSYLYDNRDTHHVNRIIVFDNEADMTLFLLKWS